MAPVKIGIIGCGQISGSYLKRAGCVRGGGRGLPQHHPRTPRRARSRHPHRVHHRGAARGRPPSTSRCSTMPGQHQSRAGRACCRRARLLREPLAVGPRAGKGDLDPRRPAASSWPARPTRFWATATRPAASLSTKAPLARPSRQAMYAAGHASERYYNVFTGPCSYGAVSPDGHALAAGPVRRVTGSAQIPFPEKSTVPEPGKTYRVTVPAMSPACSTSPRAAWGCSPRVRDPSAIRPNWRSTAPRAPSRRTTPTPIAEA